MRIVTWNINRHRRGSAADAQRIVDALAGLEPKPDVVLLQEVFLDPGFTDPLLAALKNELSLNGVFRSPHAIGRDVKSYGCVVASRWAIDLVELPEPTASGGEQWAHLVTAARVAHPTAFTAVSVHMPNGSGNGWAKIDAFEYLTSILRGLRDIPVVVGGDFNEPKRFTATGLESFGFTTRDPERTWIRAGKGATRAEGTYADWQRSVESMLGPEPEHGVRRVPPPDGLGVVTHVVGHGSDQGGRCFDHVLVSAEFQHPRLGVDDSVRSTADPKRRLSDHSMVWVDVEF